MTLCPVPLLLTDVSILRQKRALVFWLTVYRLLFRGITMSPWGDTLHQGEMEGNKHQWMEILALNQDSAECNMSEQVIQSPLPLHPGSRQLASRALGRPFLCVCDVLYWVGLTGGCVYPHYSLASAWPLQHSRFNKDDDNASCLQFTFWSSLLLCMLGGFPSYSIHCRIHLLLPLADRELFFQCNGKPASWMLLE